MNDTQFVKRINAILAEKGVEKRTFYADCKITSSAFSQWSTGRTTPREKKLREIADYLGVSYEYLMTGTKKDLPLGLSSKPVEFDVDRLTANYDDGLTDSQRDLISLIYELPDDVVLMLLSAAKEWLKNHKFADSAE